MKVKFTGVYQERPAPGATHATLQKFGNFLTGKNVQSVMNGERRGREMAAKALVLEIVGHDLEGITGLKHSQSLTPSQVNSAFDELQRKFNDPSLTLPRNASLQERKEMGQVLRLKKLFNSNLDTFVEDIEKKLSTAFTNHEEAGRILENDGWKKKSQDIKKISSEWINEAAPGYIIKLDGNTFSLYNGRTVELEKKPLDKLLEALTTHKKDGTIPGSITNNTGAL